MITYSTNWMGPVSLHWYEDRGLTTTKIVMVKDQPVEVEDITEYWSGGRIDVRGEGLGPYGDEIGLPIMRSDCWAAFSYWLNTFETVEVWTLNMLVDQYEMTHEPIIWAKDVFGVEE